MPKEKPPALSVQRFVDHQVITQPNPLRRALRRVDEREKDDPIARAEQALAAMSDEFKQWMGDECDSLAAAHATILKNGFSPEGRDELFRAAHDIKGDAATFGYPTAAIAAESLCRLLEHAPAPDAIPSDLIAHHIHAIQAIVREKAMAGMSRVVADELSNRLRTLADEFLRAANRDRPEHLEAVLAPSLVPAN